MRDLTLRNCKNVTLEGLEELKDSIKILTIVDCDLKSLAGVEKVALDELYVAGNQLATLEPMETVTSIKKLDVSNNRLEASTELYWIRNLQEIKELKLYNNKMVEDEKFETRWRYIVPLTIEVACPRDEKNEINQLEIDFIQSIKECPLSPFESWRLDVEIAQLEKENALEEEKKAALQKEVEEAEAYLKKKQAELEDIQMKVREKFGKDIDTKIQ